MSGVCKDDSTPWSFALPYVTKRDLYSSLLIAAIAIMAFALACSYVAQHGGPAWIAGQELELFIKLALGTTGIMIVDVCWKARLR